MTLSHWIECQDSIDDASRHALLVSHDATLSRIQPLSLKSLQRRYVGGRCSDGAIGK